MISRARLATGGRQYRHLAPHQFGRHRRQEIVPTTRPAKFDSEVLTLNVPALGQTGCKSRDKMCGVLRRARA